MFALQNPEELSEFIWKGLKIGPNTAKFGMIEVLEFSMPKIRVKSFEEFKDMLEQFFSDESEGLDGTPKEVIEVIMNRRESQKLIIIIDDYDLPLLNAV